MNTQRNLIGLFIFILSACSAQSGDVISVKEFKSKLSQSSTLLDVRTPDEFNEGHLEKAININIKSDQFESQCEKLEKTKPVLVYCHSGARSHRAAEMLRKKGYKVLELDGGIEAWKEKGMPVVKGK